jgi:hypothetical protein
MFKRLQQRSPVCLHESHQLLLFHLLLRHLEQVLLVELLAPRPRLRHLPGPDLIPMILLEMEKGGEEFGTADVTVSVGVELLEHRAEFLGVKIHCRAERSTIRRTRQDKKEKKGGMMNITSSMPESDSKLTMKSSPDHSLEVQRSHKEAFEAAEVHAARVVAVILTGGRS